MATGAGEEKTQEEIKKVWLTTSSCDWLIESHRQYPFTFKSTDPQTNQQEGHAGITVVCQAKFKLTELVHMAPYVMLHKPFGAPFYLIIKMHISNYIYCFSILLMQYLIKINSYTLCN